MLHFFKITSIINLNFTHIFLIMERSFVILNKKKEQSNTHSTTENSGLMLKMVSSYSIFLLIILLLFGVLYYSGLDNMRDVYDLQTTTTFSRDVEIFEQDLRMMEMYCRQLLQNSSFRGIMNMQEVSDPFFHLGREVKTSLAIDIYPEVFLPIDEVYVYLPLTGYILSPAQFCTADFYYDKVRIYPADAYDAWLSHLNSPSDYRRFIPMNDLMPHSAKTCYLYIRDMADLYFTKANALVCFVVDEQKLLECFHIMDASDPVDCLSIFDQSGQQVYSLHGDAFADAALPEETGSYTHLTYGNENLRVGKYVSPDTGYTYYYSFPAFAPTGGLSSPLTIYLIIMVFALLVGGALVFIFSRRNVAPIVGLGQELKVVTEQNSQLQEVVDKQRPLIRKSYVQQLLGGTISSEDEMRYIKDYLMLDPSVAAYNVVYVVAYNNSENAGESGTGSYLNPEEFEQIMSDSLREHFGEPFYCYSPTDRAYAILLSCDETDAGSLVMKVQDTIIHMHEELLENNGIWMFAGIGHTTDSLMHVWEAYQQAMEAVSYTTKNYIFFPYEIIKKDSNAFYYPPELSTKLIHFITTGNQPQVMELFGLIHQENIEERSLPVKLLQFLLQDIRNTLLKARFALPAGTSPETLASLDARFNEHLSFKLCEDIARTLCNLFHTDTEDPNLAATIEKYILHNYKDPSLCLNKISDEFQISESYFSHMFKEKTGVNFSVYLENIRMDEAAKLVRTTDSNLSELYIQVGYNNPATFRRAFKKIYGVTPSAMRESAGGK